MSIDKRLEDVRFVDARVLDGIRAYEHYNRKVKELSDKGRGISDIIPFRDEFNRATQHLTEEELKAVVNYAKGRLEVNDPVFMKIRNLILEVGYS